MCKFDDKIKRTIWEKAKTDPDYKSEFVRKDACGAWILYDSYGKADDIFGWEIDHIYPKNKLRALGVEENLIDDIRNLRALNCANNKSKGSDYPVYRASIKSDGETNVDCDEEKVINDSVQKTLNDLYKDYL